LNRPQPAEDEVEQHRMPLLEHLRELRSRLLWSIGLWVACTTLAFWLVNPAIAWLRAPFDQALAESGVNGGLSIVGSPMEGVYVTMRVGFAMGAVLSSPFISWHLWQFVAPGLYRSERRVVAPLALASSGLFIAGGLFCYYAILPFAFPFFLTVVDADAIVSIDGYLGSVLRMMGAFGLTFQLPVGTWFLARMGLIDHRDMWRAFRYAIVVIFIVAAVITPPDPLTQTMLSIPLCGLYVLSIGVAWAVTTKKRP
jgi:sec-independent protein translocase protein TatC